MPVAQYFDKNGTRLHDHADAAQIAYTIYEISIKPGIRYQPHPAFARNEQGEFLYHNLTAEDLADVYKLADFRHTGSRELTAEDYVFQIKRLAHPKLHSPIFGLMSDYIVGLKEYSMTLQTAVVAQFDGRAGCLSGFEQLSARRRGDSGSLHLSHQDQGEISPIHVLAGNAFFCAHSMGGRALLHPEEGWRKKISPLIGIRWAPGLICSPRTIPTV